MTILTDNKVRICNDSAIYKLIVVGVLINQTETILRRKERVYGLRIIAFTTLTATVAFATRSMIS